VEGQQAVAIHVVQGERELAADNRSLARFNILLPPMPAGFPRLEVTFLVDENGILSVSAYEHRSQAEARIEVRPSYGLTDDEVERMVIESFEHAESDLRTRQLVEARVEADQVIKATEKQLPAAEEFVRAGTMAQADLDRIRRTLAELAESTASEDHRLIRDRIETLDAASRGLAALVMDKAVKEAIEGRTLDEAEQTIRGEESQEV
jgi:molecular chaperone DnaK/molecular chaperone HscA